MNRLVLFVIGAICGAAVTAAVHHSHFVQTGERWLVVPRAGINLKDIYVDIRHWTADDWRKHPELSRDMEKAGYAEFQRPGTAENDTGDADDRLSQRLEENEPAEHPSDNLRAAGNRSEEFRPTRSARRDNDFDPQSVPE